MRCARAHLLSKEGVASSKRGVARGKQHRTQQDWKLRIQVQGQMLFKDNSFVTVLSKALALCLLLMIFPPASSQDGVDKIHIDTATRLYTSVADGRVHVFHGLAIEDSSPPWGLATYTSEQIELMKTWGLNIIRVGFQWHMVEPSQGTYNESYIQELVNFVELLNTHSVYVILDMHQDCWSPLFCNAHGIPSQYSHGYSPDYDPKGSKAYPEPVAKPEYDVNGHIINCDEVGKHIFGWATCYVTYAIGAAAQRLYDNDQGMLDRFGKFWQLITSRVMKYPNILGYELINEPWLGDVPLDFKELLPSNPHWDLWFPTISDQKNMMPMYKTLHKYIRAVDNDTIIFFEPATGGNFLDAWPVGFDEGPGGKDYNDRQAMSYHVYCPFIDTKDASTFLQYIIANLSVVSCDLLNNGMYDVRKNDTDQLKLAGFLTEFGAAGSRVAAEDTIYFAASKMDEFKHGWTYWYLTPNLEAPNTTEVRALARPFPQKIAGIPEFYQYNPLTKIFTVKYTPCTDAPCRNKPTEIFTSLNYAYAASGMKITITDIRNTVEHHFDAATQMLYVTVTKIAAGNTPVIVDINPQ